MPKPPNTPPLLQGKCSSKQRLSRQTIYNDFQLYWMPKEQGGDNISASHRGNIRLGSSYPLDEWSRTWAGFMFVPDMGRACGGWFDLYCPGPRQATLPYSSLGDVIDEDSKAVDYTSFHQCRCRCRHCAVKSNAGLEYLASSSPRTDRL